MNWLKHGKFAQSCFRLTAVLFVIVTAQVQFLSAWYLNGVESHAKFLVIFIIYVLQVMIDVDTFSWKANEVRHNLLDLLAA